MNRKELHKLYPHHYDSVEKLYTKPKDVQDLVKNYISDKLWRLNNLYQIVDVNGQKRKFQMFAAQHKVYSKLLEHHRLIILKSRQHGISTFFLVDFFDDALFISDIDCGLMALGKDRTADLLNRTKLMWDNLNPVLIKRMNIHKLTDNTQAMSFNNGSCIRIRNSFRSGTLQRLHISELGKIANIRPRDAVETNTGSLQAIHGKSNVIIESTAEGENMFKTKWDDAVEMYESGRPLSHKDFLPVFLSWADDPKCVSDIPQEDTSESIKYFKKKEEHNMIFTKEQKHWWIIQHRELKDEIYKEYPADPTDAFAKTLDGSYYGKLYSKYVYFGGRERQDLYSPELKVHVGWDLGMDGYTVMSFWQIFKNEARLIDEYYDNGNGIPHYVDILKQKRDELGYKYANHIFPHDVKVKELNTNMSRLETFLSLGITNHEVDEGLSVADGIDAVRQILPILYVDKKCEYLIKCLKNYSKEWDDPKQVWKNKPREDQWCHGADSIRMFAANTIDIWLTNDPVRKESDDGSMDF